MVYESDTDAPIITILMDYTNDLEDEPKSMGNDFYCRAFQNGVALDEAFGLYYVDEYPVLANQSKEVMGATITLGKNFLLTDDSPVTVVVSDCNGEAKQSMVIDLNEDTSAGNGETETVGSGTSAVTSTDYMTIDGIFVDESYEVSSSSNLRLVYVFYTLSTSDQNLRVDSRSAKLTFNGINTYEPILFKSNCAYMHSYYYSNNLKNIYVGESLKVVETFQVPVAELAEGNTITMEKSQVPDTEQIKLTTDEIQFLPSPEAIAEIIDPEGYALEVYNRSYADAETASKVRAAINGKYFRESSGAIIVSAEFSEPNGVQTGLADLPGGNTGTYEVLNGYLLCTMDNGAVLEIPYTWKAYTWKDGTSIDLDLFALLGL